MGRSPIADRIDHENLTMNSGNVHLFDLGRNGSTGPHGRTLENMSTIPSQGSPTGEEGATPPDAAKPEAGTRHKGSGVDQPAPQAKRAPWAAYYEEVGVSLPGVRCGRRVVYPPPLHWGKQIESELAVKWPGASSPPVKERKDLSELLATPEFIPVHAVYDDTAIGKAPAVPVGEWHDLTFESRFDSGNLARSVRTGTPSPPPKPYALHPTPETRNSKYSTLTLQPEP